MIAQAGIAAKKIDPLVALTAVSALTTSAGAFQESRAQRRVGEYESEIYETNRRLSEFQAEDILRRGELQAKEHKRKVRRLIGSQRAALAAQGQELSLAESDALAIQEESAIMGALDVLEIKNNAWREAWGYRVQASQYEAQREFARLTAKQKARQTILTGGLNIAKDIATAAYLSKVPRYGYPLTTGATS